MTRSLGASGILLLLLLLLLRRFSHVRLCTAIQIKCFKLFIYFKF